LLEWPIGSGLGQVPQQTKRGADINPLCAKVWLKSLTLRFNTVNTGRNRSWHKPCMVRIGNSLRKDTMLITLVAVLCNGQLCLEKVVTTSEQSGITMTACQINGQIGIAQWLANGPYRDWKLQRYKCVVGKYVPKSDA
jgi:hypothetical protein